MILQSNSKLKCQQNNHLDEIDIVCYNQLCTEFRLNCFKYLKYGRIHHDHFKDVEKIITLITYIENKKQECDNFIDDLNKYVESVNQTFSLLKMGIRFKYSYQLFQIHEFWVNMRMQLFGQTKHQLQILKITYMRKVFAQEIKKKYQDAIICIGNALSINSKHINSLHQKGQFLRNLNKYQDAITWLDKALAIDLKYVNSLYAKECNTLVDKALAIDPKHVSSLHEKGECLRLLKRYKESIQFLLSINQKHTFSLMSTGDCLTDLKKYKEALICYEKSLKIDPNDQYVKKKKRKN
ncbi:unnamed protein product [Paramecium pentaurelia]|uniref:Tetratricopeptide repeat protein n=1 Tax=Paramecium pentaurelia TaxID=43138 RepID=A0A8S1VXX3_9CILI|nr:unnamed protein product [Paramecium pentaurelia]